MKAAGTAKCAGAAVEAPACQLDIYAEHEHMRNMNMNICLLAVQHHWSGTTGVGNGNRHMVKDQVERQPWSGPHSRHAIQNECVSPGHCQRLKKQMLCCRCEAMMARTGAGRDHDWLCAVQ
jgi:hypothetical protein